MAPPFNSLLLLLALYVPECHLAIWFAQGWGHLPSRLT